MGMADKQTKFEGALRKILNDSIVDGILIISIHDLVQRCTEAVPEAFDDTGWRCACGGPMVCGNLDHPADLARKQRG